MGRIPSGAALLAARPTDVRADQVRLVPVTQRGDLPSSVVNYP